MAAMKQLAGEMEMGYNPANVEKDWYSWWEHSGFFKPRSDRDESAKDAKKFTIILPPPNVTGHLHLGHALTSAVQDTLIRYNRMMGNDTLYLPGTDHAGIATQVVVEKRLKATTGKSRHDFGREEFIKQVWGWKEDHAGAIQRQLRRCGASLDWSRERFTMDEQCATAVREAFVKLHEDGLVYRATRLVNWCCALQSAISDVEVDTIDVEKNAKIAVPGYEKKVDMGQLTHIAYKVVGSEEELIIATTRPETLIGDTAVAIHPDDARFKHLHGKQLQCPFRDETIPIILDAKLVDMEFGTGAVKVTPAHDRNDFETGIRHSLPSIVIFDLKGFISMEGPFKGLHRFEARKKIIEKLEEMKLLRGVTPYTYRVGICSRTGDIIEPMLMPQWFVDCQSMAAKSVEAVQKKELRIIPDSHESTWNHFLKNIEPWCVSRQLWWGHRIPAYKATLNGASLGEDAWIVARSVEEARTKAQAKFSLSDEDAAKLELDQDPDVLDTWFSSGLWPFSTMGWPNQTPDMEHFFPNSLLETGHDILFFWVARMVMLSLHFTGKLPFSEVYLHAMVRDRDGRKMSKQLGNVIDPLDVINGITLQELHDKLRLGNLDAKEIPKAEKFQKEAFPDGIAECGSDALRFGLLSYTQSGRNVNLDINRVVGYRQFCNKLWNVVRYVLYYALEPGYKPQRTSFEGVELPLECQWILSRLSAAVKECTEGFATGNYDFALATQAAYRFWLYELCDVFLELTKPLRSAPADDPKRVLVSDVLLYVVEAGLRMLHPMMPFVTEELWHRLPHYESLGTETIMLAKYPSDINFHNDAAESKMKLLMESITALRAMKASYNLTNKQKPDVYVTASSVEVSAIAAEHALIIETLAVTGKVTAVADSDVPVGCGVTVVNSDITVHMMLKGLIDVDKEVAKLTKNLEMLKKNLDTLEKKMAMPTYATKVPEAVRNADKEKHDSLHSQVKQIGEGIEKLKTMSA